MASGGGRPPADDRPTTSGAARPYALAVSREPLRTHPDRPDGRVSTIVSRSTRRLGAVLAITALVLVIVGGLFASGSDARKHRARTGTTADTSPSETSPVVETTHVPTSGVTQLTLHPKAASGTPTSTKPATPPTPATRPATTSLVSNRSDSRLRSIGFRSQSRLDDHFAKHGREFGSITETQYLSMAQDLRDAALSKTVIEATQANGSISRFDRATGGFLAFDRDLTIRTFYRPNDGEAYFRRAAGKNH